MRNLNKNKEQNMGTSKFYIVAISGDVSARGMGDTADAIFVDKKYHRLVSDYLVAQTKWSNECLISKPSKSTGNKFFALQLKLWDANIFTNKYQSRSKWSLEVECDLELLGFKYQIVKESK